MILLYKAKENGLSSGSYEGENDSQICPILSKEPVDAPNLQHTKKRQEPFKDISLRWP